MSIFNLPRGNINPVKYLCFTANAAGSTIKLDKKASATSVTLETSTDLMSWNTYTTGNIITLTNIGDKVYWRNRSETTTRFSINSYNCWYFTMTGDISASGDVGVLLNKNSTDTVSVGCYASLFEGCTALTSIDIILPATTLAEECYTQMFQGCTSLTNTPVLPATTLANSCYSGMFTNCTSLVDAPALPATTLANSCYRYMFQGCTSLTNATALPATTLANYCYNQMFQGCTSLTSIPALPATTLANYCYQFMFYKCSKIKLSKTQTGDYQTPYRIPSEGTGIDEGVSDWNKRCFSATGGTFTRNPTINTTYYTSNVVI